MGDTLLAVPALAALRAAGYRPLTLAGNPLAAPLLLANDLVDRFVSQDSSDLLWLFGSPANAASGWRRYDVLVVWSTSVDVRLARAVTRCVIQAPSRPDASCHASDYLVDSLRPLGVRGAPASVRLQPPAGAREEAERWLTRRGNDDRPLVAIHPGSGSPRKNWPAERFRLVADQLGRLGYRVLLVLGPAEQELGKRILAHAPGDWLVADSLELSLLAALLTRARVYLGNDSGVTHLAALLGVPTVALFGASNPALWAPRGPKVMVLEDPGWTALGPGDVVRAVLGLAT